MGTIAQKLTSRKLWVTLLALAGLSLQEVQGVEWWQALIVGLVAVAYVVAEGLVDRARAQVVDQVADTSVEELEAVLARIKAGLERGRAAAGELAPGDVGGLAAPAAVDPQLVVLLVQLVEKLLSLFKRRKK